MRQRAIRYSTLEGGNKYYFDARRAPFPKTTKFGGLRARPYPSVSVSTSPYLSVSLSISQHISVSLSTPQYLSVLLSTSQYLSVSLSISHYLSVSLSISQYLSASLSISQYPSVPLNISQYLPVSPVSLSTSQTNIRNGWPLRGGAKIPHTPFPTRTCILG